MFLNKFVVAFRDETVPLGNVSLPGGSTNYVVTELFPNNGCAIENCEQLQKATKQSTK